MPLTVTNGGGRPIGRFLWVPSSPVGALVLTVTGALGGVSLILLAAFTRPTLPWLSVCLFGPPALLFSAVAASTAPEGDCPANRAERVLRGVLGGGSTLLVLVLVLMLFHESAAAASALAVAGGSMGLLTGTTGGERRAGRHGVSPAGPKDSARALELAGEEVTPQSLPPLCRLLKRSLDVVMASVVLVLALPVLALSAGAIRAEDGGGVLFSHTRVGLDGRPFRMHKLRTMRPANDDGEHRAYVADLIRGRGQAQRGMYKLLADDRRTRVGRVLRTFSIDELPQLWNVLRGDMSLVGPRPPLPAEVALYDQVTRARLAAKPGLTGLWQVSGRSRLSFQEMVDLDLRYRQEWSPLLDLRILLRTPKAVVWGRETA